MPYKKAADCTPEQLATRRARGARAEAKRRGTRRVWARAWEARNSKHISEVKRAWAKKNPERWKRTSTARAKRWRDKNREAMCTYAARRRAKLRHAAGGCPKARTAYDRWARKHPKIPCYWCKAATHPGGRHIDHIIPLAAGGSDAVANLCVSCPSCNQAKSARLPEHFAGQAELRFA